MTFTDAKKRFSNRVADYVRYRPGYPTAVLDLLRAECGLRPEHLIADIGSGTGLLSELFLKNGNRVFGVEPNQEMREGGEEYLQSYPGFASVNGSAEATTLANGSVDFVSAGQAFHWFDPEKTRAEFRRILRPQGWVVIVWNERLTDTTPFLRDYEALVLKFGTDYSRVNESYPREERMCNFFGAHAFTKHDLENFQEFDFEGLSGRLRSSSYAPAPSHPNFAPMMAELERIFRAHQRDGRVRMKYWTRIYFGQLRAVKG
jgi:SAM-dependent methyltransferase